MIFKLDLLYFFVPVVFLNAQVNTTVLGNLPDDVLESSGLIFYNDKLITHNDSGNLPQLYEVDPSSLEILRIVTINNAANVDWEDITQDDTFIYIGDFGNKAGNRQDLSIYRVPKSEYDLNNSVNAERIDFSYEDQSDFLSNQNSDWDAEAMVNFNEQLLLFTKQWKTKGTVAYSIPKIPGSYSAKNLGFYNVSGLVTGAAYNEFSDVLMLLGYSSQLQPFVVRIEGPDTNFSFNGSVEKQALGIGFAQVEGITYSDSNTYYVSSERFQNTTPSINLESQLFTFKTDDSPSQGKTDKVENDVLIYKPFGSNELHYDLNSNVPLFGRAIFDITGKRVRYTNGALIENNSIDLSGLGSAVYYLTFYLQGETITKPFILE